MTAPIAPLDGIKVLDLSRVLAGPWCAQMLGDLGAEVIKVERPEAGDDTRHWGPPYLHTDDGTKTEQASYYNCCNRNKRSITIDMASPQGQALIVELAKDADILVENFKVGGLKAYGLDYESLRKINPRLIYCSVTGFGQTGPYAPRAGYDLIAQGMSGIMSLTGEGPGRPPVKVGVPIGDVTAGILASTGVLAAYIERLRTGEGQYVDTSLYEASLVHTYWQVAMAFATGESAGPMGSAHPVAAPYQAIPTQDGWINIGAVSQATWVGMTRVLQLEHLLEDERFASNRERMANRDLLIAIISEAMRSNTTDYWVEKFEQAGVPAGPVRKIKDMLEDPQTLARDMVIEVDHPVAGPVQALGLPIKFSHGNGVTRRGAPQYGEHTAEVLQELGYSSDDIAALAASQAVQLHGR